MIDNYELLRQRMVETQIIPRGIKDQRVIKAMLKVPRHQFVPSAFQHQAYDDHPLPIGSDQTISQPYIVAAMTEYLEVKKENKVLEIGTGSGYQTAILAELAKIVYTVERFSNLSQEASQRLRNLGYTNVRFKVGNGFFGWKEFAPYDRIIVTAAATEIPLPLAEQLAEKGRMVLPIGPAYAQKLFLVIKTGDKLKSRPLFDCVFVPLVSDNVGA
ncbi:MAG: protein-L-isoaspartate(D-aspartate) O-methyltransferase [candidate division WOR-3 bacterium]